MELYKDAIELAVHPTAAFAADLEGTIPEEEIIARGNSNSWSSSLLNPKNRIDSLDEYPGALWRIDGCAGLGTQFYAIPTFFRRIPPLRMDVFIPEDQNPIIRNQLDLHIAFHTKDGRRLSRLAAPKYIVRVLQHWTTTEFDNLKKFEEFYCSAPFGSRIVFDYLSLDIHQVKVKVGLNHNLERQLLPLSALSRLWGPDLVYPEIIDFFELHVVSVLHDSVCLVEIRGELYIFKALTSGAKYLYHELKTLCTLQPHPNIIARPIHLVQKHVKFGGKKAIAGFTTYYHASGTIRDVLPTLRLHNRLELATQFKWSIQLTGALEHLRHSESTYYPDLRLDNIVLSEDDDVVMIDFEQRGVWCEFAAPEVNSVEYLRLLATQEDLDEEIKAEYLAKLIALVPDYDDLEQEKYTNPKDGYNIAWLALSPTEQEAAEVYMLGRVLWCIFEGVSGPQKAAVWQSYQYEPHIEFPEYRLCPEAIRPLIDDCTRGRREPLSRQVMRKKSRLVLPGPLDAGYQNPAAVIAAAQEFWTSEVRFANDFLKERSEQKARGDWNDNHFKRPTLKEVLQRLDDLRAQLLSRNW